MNYVYEIENFTEIRDDVLAWVRHQLRSYSHVKITGLNSFSNGVPFLALLHAVDHKLVDLDQFEMTDKKRLLATVFQLAEKYLDIPPLLSPDAIVEGETPEALLLYLYIFKIKIEVLSMKKNPIGTIQNEVSRLRHLVKHELSVLDGVKVDFDETVLRISDLTDDQQNQRMEFYKQRSERTEEAIKEALEVNKVLYRQNELLKEKNDKLHERIKTLEKLAEYEAEERRRLQEQFTLQEKLRAIEELLSEEDIEQYIAEAKKGNPEPIGSNSKIDELNDILGNKPKSKAQQMMRMKNLSSGKDKPKQIQRSTGSGGLHNNNASAPSAPSETTTTSPPASQSSQAVSDAQVTPLAMAPMAQGPPSTERPKSVTFSANGGPPVPASKPDAAKLSKAKEDSPSGSPRRLMSPRGRRNMVSKNSQELDP